MNKDSIKQIINRVSDDAFFVGKASDARIKEIERILKVTLPESYKWFLQELGHGGVSGVEILGNGLGEIPSCVKATESWRVDGLPNSLIVIEDGGGDWIYCLDTSQLINNECSVINWAQNIGIGGEYYQTFFDFFGIRLMDSINFT